MRLGRVFLAVFLLPFALRAAPAFAPRAIESFRKALDYHNHNELALAAAEYRVTLGLDPTLVSAVINLAIIHEKWLDLPMAENLYNDAVRIAPRSFAARYNRGQFLQKLGRLAEAREDYAAALEIKPDEASLFVNTAGIEIRLFEEKHDISLLSSAEKNLNRASSLKSKSPALYFNRARLMEHMNFPARARVFYEEAMRYYAPKSTEYKTCTLRAERISRQLR